MRARVGDSLQDPSLLALIGCKGGDVLAEHPPFGPNLFSLPPHVSGLQASQGAPGMLDHGPTFCVLGDILTGHGPSPFFALSAGGLL